MKKFNLQVTWNETDKDYDVLLEMDRIPIGEGVEMLTTLLVGTLSKMCNDNDYCKAVASTTAALLIGEKIDKSIGHKLTLEQKQRAIENATELLGEIEVERKSKGAGK